METRTITICTFRELPPEAQKRALDKWQTRAADVFYGVYSQDYYDTLEAFEELTGIRFDGHPYRQRFKDSWGHDILSLSGVRLWKYLQNSGIAKSIAEDCPLTGFCADEDILRQLRAFLKHPDDGITFRELAGQCYTELQKTMEAEYEYVSSADGFTAYCDANEVMFFESGVEYGPE